MSNDPEELIVPKVVFLCEQDGASEIDFKRSLCDAFVQNEVRGRANLARVHYGDEKEFNVALRVRLFSDINRLQYLVASLFADTFRTDEHLDVLLLTEADEIRDCILSQPLSSHNRRYGEPSASMG